MPHLDGDLVLQHGPEVLDVLLLVLQPRHHLALLVQPSLLTRPPGEKYLGSSCVIRIKIFESHQQYLYLPIYLTTDRRQRPSWEFDKMVRGGWTLGQVRRCGGGDHNNHSLAQLLMTMFRLFTQVFC